MNDEQSPPEDLEYSETADSPTPSHPDRIGPYRILQKIGVGGMGEVFEAEQEKPVRRKVALKVIKWGMDTKQVVARFEAERQALALMDHPAIAKVFEAGATEQGRPYFSMEYVKGEPITTYCDKHRLTTRERLILFMQVCEGIQHAHQKGIIHRDLKPTNVLVTIQDNKPVPKIIDFGVAKATEQRLTEKTVFTQMGVLIGTPSYMSPEQAEMTGLDIDTRTDVYSLGAMLYELLAGALPFDPRELRDAGFDELRRRIREDEPSRPSTKISTLGDKSVKCAKKRHTNPANLAKQLRGDLDWITMRALEKDRTRRYGSPSELAMDIERHLKDKPVLASPPTITYKAQKFVRRHKAGVAAGFLLLLALLIGVAGTTIGFVRAKRAESQAKLAEAQAKQEAATAAAVSTFLIALFEVSDPSEALGNTITAREILDIGADRIGPDLGDHPLVQARLLSTMGTVYKNLGLLEKADSLFEKALRTNRKELGDDHPATLASLADVGTICWAQDRLSEAEPCLQEALLGLRHALGDDHPNTLALIANVGSLFLETGRVEEAEPYLREALEGHRRTLGDDHPSTLTSIDNAGRLLQAQGKFEEAELYFRESLEGRRRVLGNYHPATLTSINNSGSLLEEQRKFKEAELFYRAALEGCRRVLGDDHWMTLVLIDNIGSLLDAQGKLDEAEPYFREALEGLRQSRGSDHPDTMLLLNRLGKLLHAQGNLEEAERCYRERLDALRHSLGDKSTATLAAINDLGSLLNARGRFEEAEPLLREAVEGFRNNLGDAHPNTLAAINNMGSLLQEQARLDEADPYIREALDGSRSVLGEDHPTTLTIINNMGTLLQAQGKLDEAEPYMREALERHRRVQGNDHPNTIGSMGNLGDLLAGLARYSEAESLLGAAAAKARRVLPPKHPLIGGTIRKYGSCLTGIGRFESAEIALLEAYDLLALALGTTHYQAQKAVLNIVELYDSWGKEDKAAEWRGKIVKNQ